MTMHEQDKKMGELIAKAWNDEAFMQRLLTEATTVFKEQGIPVPEGVTIKAVANTPTLYHFVIPPKVASTELTKDFLGSITGGIDQATHHHPDQCGINCWRA